MTKPIIRAAEPNDIGILIELMRAAHAEAGYTLDSALAAGAYARLLRDPALGRVWIAFRNHVPAGQVVLTFKLSLESGGVDAFIEDLFVQPDARRHGVGGALLDTAMKACREEGVSAVHVEVGADNDAAKALYAKHGLASRDRLILSTELRPNRMARPA